jgi:hypothetical protein
LGDQALGLHFGQDFAYRAAADLVLLAQFPLGGHALAGLPVAAMQLIKQAGTKEVGRVHDVVDLE